MVAPASRNGRVVARGVSRARTFTVS